MTRTTGSVERRARTSQVVGLAITTWLIAMGQFLHSTAASADATRAHTTATEVDPLHSPGPGPSVRRPGSAGLERMLEHRVLRVLTAHEGFDPSIADAAPTGDQIGLWRALTEYLNTRHPADRYQAPIRVVLIPVHPDELISRLVAGRGDLAVTRLEAPVDRSSQAAFAIRYRVMDEVLIGHPSAPPVRSLDDLSERTVAVRRDSSFHDALLDLDAWLRRRGRAPIQIVALDAGLETEDVVALVAEGRFQYTVADSRIAGTLAAVSPVLHIVDDLPFRANDELAWAALPSTPRLAAVMRDFLDRYRHGGLPEDTGVRRRLDREPFMRTRLSEPANVDLSRYDHHFRRFADRYGFDWRLLAAIAHQESRFRQSARNRWGATGLFQIKPKTAREPYIDIHEIAGLHNAGNNVHAGTRYLCWIKERYFDPIEAMHERDRVHMSLAAYNAGPRTLLRARRQARQMGLDPNRWFRNVEVAMLAMNKREPVEYVSEINQRYLSYMMRGVE